MSAPRILAVDDDPLTLKLLARVLGGHGCEVVRAASGSEALRAAAGQAFDVALVDVVMPGMSGIELLRELKRLDPTLDVLMMTAHPEVRTAVEAFKESAFDYLEKPLNIDALRQRVNHVVERRSLRREVRELRGRLGERPRSADLVGVSPALNAVRTALSEAAGTDAPLLISGESGTGKQVAAAAMHRLSRRSGGPFIPVNVAAIPAELVESEFFGHVRGAFAGAVSDTLGLVRSAHGGTLYVDDIAALPPAVQRTLLRACDEKRVRPLGSTNEYPADVRLVAATTLDLDRAAAAGTFRSDLLLRLSLVRMRMPPLRERRDDVPPLVTHFVQQLNARFGRSVRGVTSEALALLSGYDFPGNVRELEGLIERAYAKGALHEIGVGDLPALQLPTLPATAPTSIPTLPQVERELILRAIDIHPRDREAAARALGISVRTLFRRLKEYGI
jgi:DNA-binding NtrC family response regulator